MYLIVTLSVSPLVNVPANVDRLPIFTLPKSMAVGEAVSCPARGWLNDIANKERKTKDATALHRRLGRFTGRLMHRAVPARLGEFGAATS
jgi:hypothetical protein